MKLAQNTYFTPTNAILTPRSIPTNGVILGVQESYRQIPSQKQPSNHPSLIRALTNRPNQGTKSGGGLYSLRA